MFNTERKFWLDFAAIWGRDETYPPTLANMAKVYGYLYKGGFLDEENQ